MTESRVTEILASTWWTPMPPPPLIIGAVAQIDPGDATKFNCYIGTAHALSQDQLADERRICKRGARLGPTEAKAIWPEFWDLWESAGLTYRTED